MAHLLIIELPGGNDTDVVDSAIQRGDEFTFLSSHLDHYRSQPQVRASLAAAREQIEVPSFHYAEVERSVLELHARHAIDAVLCLVDIRLTEAARLAARLGLAHLNPASASLMRDKHNVRCRLSRSGVIQPPFELATSNDELKAAVDRIGLPVLIKPNDGYGSQNIVALRFPEDLDPLLSPLDGFLPMRSDYGLGVKASGHLLVERYMTGTVIGCDTLTVDGRHRLLGIHEKSFFEPPSFAIRGGCFTPNCPEFKSIESYLFAVLDALEFDWGAAHTELMLTANGPRLIEVNPRVVGAKIPRLVGHALGRSIHADLIDVHLGAWPTGISDTSGVAVTRWIVADRQATLDRVEVPQWSDPRVRCFEVLRNSGEVVRPPFENADRIGYVMVCAPTRLEAEKVAEAFVRECRITYLPSCDDDTTTHLS